MTPPRPAVACLGAGRMGRGIAVAFAYAGHRVTMIDVKARSDEQFAKLEAEALGEVEKTLASLARFGLLNETDAKAVIARVAVVPVARRQRRAGRRRHRVRRRARGGRTQARGAGSGFEDASAPKSSSPRPRRPSWSTTSPARSSIPSVSSTCTGSIPAYLIPLVEISPGAATDPAVIAQVKALLEGIGKVPVVCAATPGFIVPRIQALAMNEAARMVEEGVASAEDIDKAIRYGFGFRYAVLGPPRIHRLGRRRYSLLRQPLSRRRARQRPLPRAGRDRAQHANEGRIGLRTGAGFLDYSGLDIDAYREQRLAALVDMLRHFGLARPPVGMISSLRAKRSNPGPRWNTGLLRR